LMIVVSAIVVAPFAPLRFRVVGVY
jgi:hypothetical protein